MSIKVSHTKEDFCIKINRLKPIKINYRYTYNVQKGNGEGNIPLYPEIGLKHIDIQSDNYWLQISYRNGKWISNYDRTDRIEDLKWEYPLVEIHRDSASEWRISLISDTYNVIITFTRFDGIILYEENTKPTCEFNLNGINQQVLHIVLEWESSSEMINITETTYVKLPIQLQSNYMNIDKHEKEFNQISTQLKRPLTDLKLMWLYPF